MKHAFFLAILLSVHLFALPCFGQESTGLRMGMSLWRPYQYLDEHTRPAGICFESTRSVLETMGIVIRSLDILPWNQGLRMLELGEIDILISGVHVPKHEHVYLYPDEPLIIAQWQAFVHCYRDRPSAYRSIDDLKDKRVGVICGRDYPQEFMNALSALVEPEVVNKDETNFRKLIGNRLDVVLADHLNGLWLLHDLGLDSQVCAASVPIGSRALYALFSKKTVRVELVHLFSEELRRLKTDPEYARQLKRVRHYGE